MQRFKQLHAKKGKVFGMPLILRGVLSVAAVAILIFIARGITRRVAPMIVPVYSDSTAHLFYTKKSLASQVTELQTTIASYEAQLATLSTLQKENEELKAELGRHPIAKGILGHVLTASNRSFYDTIIIDAGSDDGVIVGQNAYAFDSIALGTVSAVEKKYSTIELFSAPGRETAGTAEGSEVAVTLIGRGAGEYEVRMPRNVPFDIGSTISEQSIHVAVLAQVEKVITDARDPFQRLLAKAPVNLQALKWVIVRY